MSEADEGSMIANKIRITQVRGKRTFVHESQEEPTAESIDESTKVERSLKDFKGRFSDLRMP